MQELSNILIGQDIKKFLKEDGFTQNFGYWNSLPSRVVTCHLKIKSDCTMTGLPWFIQTFKQLDSTCDLTDLMKHEGKTFDKNQKISFELPFSVALSGERVALNLLQHASAIATYTSLFVKKAAKKNIKILDTRKTTPGLRQLEKYAVTVAGGYNHRTSQTDMWMIKDNHKKIFGSVAAAVAYFRQLNTLYTPLLLEVHAMNELEKGLELGIVHFMLDNFSKDDVQKALTLKKANVTFEISGGINLDNIDEYLVDGIDAISIGGLTQGPPRIDLSLKMDIPT